MAVTKSSDGVDVSYTWESGPRPVVLVHGFATTAQLTWVNSGWERALAGANRGILMLDLRGHGLSGKPHESSGYSLGLMVDDVLAAMDAAGVVVADVIAYSLGSQVALTLAGTSPERVNNLVLGGIGLSELFSTWDADSVRSFLLEGKAMDDPVATKLLTGAKMIPGADPQALLACIEGIRSQAALSVVPRARMLVAAGELDTAAVGASSLADELGAEFLSIPGRNHMNALSARSFKEAALEFLDAEPA